ncbi:chromaffin granule amine transporter-like [Epargyreus clarus]|uniref:chromaffin granule amine transporter-like n=1 Tax=Epargyreus clarus TaxID=520877 RepID=UPI003C303EB7
MTQEPHTIGAVAFALVYFTFFLDNVLLTVLVPIIPDWIRGESLALWAAHGAPLAQMLNATVQHAADEDAPDAGVSAAGVGAVLGAKAAAQLLAAPRAAALVARRGPAAALRLATALLAAAAIVFGGCAGSGARGLGGAVCAGGGRVAQGGGAALGGVAGLALCARLLPPARAHAALGALLGAVALGVLVGYPFGGAAYLLWSPAAPFQLITVALLLNLGTLLHGITITLASMYEFNLKYFCFTTGLQYMFLNKEEYNMVSCMGSESELDAGASGWRALAAEARRGAAGGGAGGVLLTTSVMAALEPCLPVWIMHKFHPQRWALGAAFLPDSAGYLVAASALGGAARRLGAERVALAGQLAVGLAALAVPHATSITSLGAAQLALGGGLGALDAALLPALLRAAPAAPPAAALLQAAASAAYAIGPVVGGVLSWWAGFETAMRTLGVANLLYMGYLYKVLREHPLSEQWGAVSAAEDAEDDEQTPLERRHLALH